MMRSRTTILIRPLVSHISHTQRTLVSRPKEAAASKPQPPLPQETRSAREAKLEAKFLSRSRSSNVDTSLATPDAEKEKELHRLQSTVQEYHKQGNATEALKTAQELYKASKKILGANHPATASAHSNIGLQYKILGQWDESRKEYEAALNIYKTTVGWDHASTASVHHNWGTLLRTQLHLDSSLSATDRMSVLEMALDHMQSAYAIRLDELGPEHPHTVASRSGWGATLAAQLLQKYKQSEKGVYRAVAEEEVSASGWDAAEDHLRQALETAIASPRGPGLQKKRRHTKTKRKAAAANKHKDSDESSMQTLSAASAGQNLATVLKARAMVTDDKTRLQEARHLYEQVLKVRTGVLPANHPDLYSTKFSLAELLQAQGDEEAANAIRTEILDTYDPPEDENGGVKVAKSESSPR